MYVEGINLRDVTRMNKNKKINYSVVRENGQMDMRINRPARSPSRWQGQLEK